MEKVQNRTEQFETTVKSINKNTAFSSDFRDELQLLNDRLELCELRNKELEIKLSKI